MCRSTCSFRPARYSLRWKPEDPEASDMPFCALRDNWQREGSGREPTRRADPMSRRQACSRRAIVGVPEGVGRRHLEEHRFDTCYFLFGCQRCGITRGQGFRAGRAAARRSRTPVNRHRAPGGSPLCSFSRPWPAASACQAPSIIATAESAATRSALQPARRTPGPYGRRISPNTSFLLFSRGPGSTKSDASRGANHGSPSFLIHPALDH